MNSYLVFAIPLGISLTHLLGVYGRKMLSGRKEMIRSFASGFSIAYVFLFLLKELPYRSVKGGIDAVLIALIGFSLFHGAHKYIFTRARKAESSQLLLDEIHLVTSAMYSFLVTFSMVEVAQREVWSGLLLAALVMVHLGLTEMSHRFPSNYVRHIQIPFLVTFTLLGGLVPILGWTNRLMTAIVFGLTSGAVIYTAIREELPNDSEGKPIWFLSGVTSLIVVSLLA